MSTTTSQSQLPRVVRDFLAAEKENSRVWLRAEMDRLVDPLVDSVFARLTNKLMINMGWGQLGDARDSARVKREIIEEDDEMTLQNVMDNAPEGNQQIGDCVKQEIKEEEDGQMMLIKKEEEEEGDANEVDLDNANEGDEEADDDVNRMMNNANVINSRDIDTLFPGWMRGEVEFGEPTRDNNFELMPMSHQTQNADMSLINASTISNEAQSNLTIREEDNEDHVNRNIQHQFDHETNNIGGMMRIVEEEEIEDGETLVTDNEELAANVGGDDESSRLVKRPRMDSTQSNNSIGEEMATESTSGPIQPNLVQPNLHLQRHLQVPTGERSFQCDQCDKRFSLRRNLKRHQLVHQNIKNYRCTECDKQFTRKDLLDSHLRTHSGERPFQCRHCEMSFTKSDTRTSHERAIHLHVKPYRCKQCGHSTTVLSHTIRHIRLVHFGLPATIKEQRELNIVDERNPRELVEKV